jgi:hypothetical protein
MQMPDSSGGIFPARVLLVHPTGGGKLSVCVKFIPSAMVTFLSPLHCWLLSLGADQEEKQTLMVIFIHTSGCYFSYHSVISPVGDPSRPVVVVPMAVSNTI